MIHQSCCTLLSPLIAVALVGCSGRPDAAPLVRIVARDYSYDMPAQIPAGMIHLRLVNHGPDMHEALIVGFGQTGGSASEYVDSVRANVDFPAFAADLGGAGLVVASDSSDAWLELNPGHYAVVCWKGDHLQRGMARDFEVVVVRVTPTSAPEADLEIELSEYAYRVTGALTEGRHIIHLRNTGHQAHEIDLFRLPPGGTVGDYVRWSAGDEQGLPPATPIGGIGDMFAGHEVWIPITLSPGRYFMICQIKDSSDGRPHYQRGMFREFEVR